MAGQRVVIYESRPKEAAEIRRAVFMEEQGFRNEFDETDQTARHAVLYVDGFPAATCRFYPGQEPGSWLIGRIAVQKAYRGQHLGASIVRAAEEGILAEGGSTSIVHAQTRVCGFYASMGYVPFGEPDDDEGFPHTWMKKVLKST